MSETAGSGVAPLKAPFPWFGGKSRASSLIWDRLGDVANYVEPFAGSLAVLLARPHAPKIETVNDKDAYLANFWRATQSAPEEVARWADCPVLEADLHARHRWLLAQTDFRERMLTDPDFYDAKIAGWWVWGLCSWIGSGWCDVTRGGAIQLPHLGDAGRGVHRKLPHLGDAGRGVHRKLPHLGDAGQGIHRKLPHLGDAGRGVHRAPSQQLPRLDGHGGAGDAGSTIGNLVEYFDVLQARLRRVRVACGEWDRILGPSVLRCAGEGATGILLDPPYAEGNVDYSASGDRSLSARVRAWALERGADTRLRIALCGYESEHPMPPTWECVAWKAQGGYANRNAENQNAKRERIWFSPGCLKARQPSLFGGTK